MPPAGGKSTTCSSVTSGRSPIMADLGITTASAMTGLSCRSGIATADRSLPPERGQRPNKCGGALAVAKPPPRLSLGSGLWRPTMRIILSRQVCPRIGAPTLQDMRQRRSGDLLANGRAGPVGRVSKGIGRDGPADAPRRPFRKSKGLTWVCTTGGGRLRFTSGLAIVLSPRDADLHLHIRYSDERASVYSGCDRRQSSAGI